MSQKQSNIAAFIDSLPMDQSLVDCQSTLLTTSMNALGAGGDN